MRSRMGWISKAPRQTRRGPRWDARVYVGGEHPYLNKTFQSEKEATRWVREMESKKDQGQRPTTDKRTLAQYLSEWVALKEQGAVVDRNGKFRAPGPRTLDDYRRLATEWIIAPRKLERCEGIGRTRIDRVTFQTLNTLYDAMKDVMTVGTVKKLHRLLGQAFVELERKGILPRNPADWANVPQVPGARGVREHNEDGDVDESADSSAQAMDERQAEVFLNAARALADEQEQVRDREHLIPERCWSALWHVLLGAGLRPGEAFGLKWKGTRRHHLR